MNISKEIIPFMLSLNSFKSCVYLVSLLIKSSDNNKSQSGKCALAAREEGVQTYCTPL
jgi:hypothetical protein